MHTLRMSYTVRIRQTIRVQLTMKLFSRLLIVCWLSLSNITAMAETSDSKISRISANTPSPTRFVVQGTSIVDSNRQQAVFFKGIGYSPFLRGETPLQGAIPGDDGRYAKHLALITAMNANYIQLFPVAMPTTFYTELDKTNLVYGQDIWLFPYAFDYLEETYQKDALTLIKSIIDHVYQHGRPDRLVLFSIGDEFQPESVARTDARNPLVTSYKGKHIEVANRTPTEVAIAQLIDSAMEYELQTYQRRHLYCHTSYTHIGPLADRKDLEVPYMSALSPDIGDLICLNMYTYAKGVVTSNPGSMTGSTYQGYLEDLAAQSSKPILITQVGLSTSPIVPKSWVPGFGGHSVEDAPKTFRAVWQDIHTAKGHEKFAGLAFFEFQDEWWKSGEESTDSTRHEREDPEEWFGIYEVGADNQMLAKGKIADTIKELFRSLAD